MHKFIQRNIYVILGFFFVFLLFSLRFYNLTILPVFADEAIYIRWSQIMKAEETLRFLPLSDGKPPLFMWIVIPFLKIFSDPLFAGRIVSVLSGLGSLIGVAVLSYLLFKSKKASLIASLFYSVSPYTFFFNRLSLADSMLSMFGIWVFIFSYLAIIHSRLDFAMISGFFLGGALLTKSPALFFALCLPTLWVFTAGPRNLWKSVLLTLVSILIGYGMFNILRLGPNFHMLGNRDLDYVYPLSHILERPLDPLKVFLTMFFEWFFSMGPALVLIPALFIVFWGYKKYWREISVLTIWILFPLVVQAEFAKVFTARYTLFLVPFIFVLASGSFALIKDRWRLVTLFVTVLFIQSMIFNFKLITKPETASLHKSERSGYLEEWTAGQGIKEIADYIRSEQIANPSQKIVVGTEGYFGTLPDGLQMYLNDLSQITVIGVGIDLKTVPDQLVNSKDFGNKTYLVINNERLKGEPNQMGLKLVSSFDKAKRLDGTFQKLQLFELIQTKSNPN